MNAMTAALTKTAKEDPEFQKMMDAAEVIHNDEMKRKEKERQRVMLIRQQEFKKRKAEEDAKNLLIRNAAEADRLLVHNAKTAENRGKLIWIWKVIPILYSMECGIVFADTEEEAYEIISNDSTGALKIFIAPCDCADTVVRTGEYYE